MSLNTAQTAAAVVRGDTTRDAELLWPPVHPVRARVSEKDKVYCFFCLFVFLLGVGGGD